MSSLGPRAPQKTQSELPKEGHSSESIIELLGGYKEDDEARWKGGQLSGAVYHGEDDHLDLLNEAAGMFAVANPLHSSTWPSVNKFEAEVIAMTASILGGGKDGDDGVCGCMTSGGTESILMAAKTHRQWGEVEKGITEPEVVCAGSAHAAIYKAADILRLKIVEVPIDEVRNPPKPKPSTLSTTSFLADRPPPANPCACRCLVASPQIFF